MVNGETIFDVCILKNRYFYLIGESGTLNVYDIYVGKIIFQAFLKLNSKIQFANSYDNQFFNIAYQSLYRFDLLNPSPMTRDFKN